VTERGLKGNVDFWLDADEGELDNLRFRALEKLHFFEGVLGITETDSLAEFDGYCWLSRRPEEDGGGDIIGLR
jgi:hypothetical protein